MGRKYLKCFTFVLLALGFSTICAAQDGITLSIYTVTSKSITAQWTPQSIASSYKITATPISSSEPPVFTLFSENVVIGSVISLSPNTVYIVRVDAMDDMGRILTSAEIEGTTAPDVPVINEAYSEQGDSITVDFSPMFGASAYIVRLESETLDFFSEIQVSDTPATLSSLQPFTEYAVSIMSVNAGGRSQPSLVKIVKTVVGTLELNTSSPTNDSIVLTWEMVEHAVLYTLSLSEEGSSITVQVNTTNTTMTFTDLEPGTTYCISANAWGSDHLPSGDAHVCQITRPPVPEFVYIMLASGRSVGVAVYWDSVRGAESYFVVSSTGQNCSSFTNSYCVISPLLCGQNHSITVTAENQAGPSYPSNPEDFLTFPCPPDSLWAEEAVSENCTIIWKEVFFVDYYKAFMRSHNENEELCNTTSNACSFHCKCGTTFFLTVFAFNLAGVSPPGPIINYTTTPCCPDNVSVSLISTETLEITWAPSRGADIYETKAVGTSDLINCNDTAPICVLSDLSCDTIYDVVVVPCSEIRGCTHTCKPYSAETAPCSPEILNIMQTNVSSVNISWSISNNDANYLVNVVGQSDSRSCQSSGSFCEVSNLTCGSVYEITAFANTSVGQSLPSYSVNLETGPCCPQGLTVKQVTRAMTNVTWPAATGARSYIASLKSPRGDAKCHTINPHCLMGCITCGTNYTVSLDVISSTGKTSECTYQGFSSGDCCPSNIRLYSMANNTIRVYWHSFAALSNYTAILTGMGSNYSCRSYPGRKSCDITGIVCGEMYTVVVAPLSADGAKVEFCPRRRYSVSCYASDMEMVMSWKRRRSVN
ncbi:fibronectin type III domain-containing protein 7-like [Brienomyrus brachyistius]|uniref:fibronectin type III domain-containing protein 7-like n=1 Tax=Brienomyrus brachyistius TaxID=42636 RepID=UPI0020B269AB|nr:fibronectin type III domain-containing protein 7-like [Brienomyrus brachyistius]